MTTFKKEFDLTYYQVKFIEYFLAINNFKYFSVILDDKGIATINFENEAEYTAFILKDILNQAEK